MATDSPYEKFTLSLRKDDPVDRELIAYLQQTKNVSRLLKVAVVRMKSEAKPKQQGIDAATVRRIVDTALDELYRKLSMSGLQLGAAQVPETEEFDELDAFGDLEI